MAAILLNNDVHPVSESLAQVSTKTKTIYSYGMLSRFRIVWGVPEPWLPRRETIERIKVLLRPHFYTRGSVWPAPLDHQDNQPIEVAVSHPVGGVSVHLGEDEGSSHGSSQRTFPSQIQRRRHPRRRHRRASTAAHCTTELLVFLLTHIVLVVSHIGVGWRYFNDCPASPLVPVYLVTIGLLLSVRLLCLLIENSWHDRGEHTVFLNICTVANFILCLTLYALFISGCVLIFGLRTWSLDPRSPHYCHSVVYWFTKLTTIGFLMIVLTTCAAVAMLYYCGGGSMCSSQ